MRRQILILGSVLLIASSGSLFAAGPGGQGNGASSAASSGPHTATPNAFGQPNQSCQAEPETPGNSIFAPGSAFNPGGIAGMMYAGQQPQNSRNPASVAQYDVACANQP